MILFLFEPQIPLEPGKSKIKNQNMNQLLYAITLNWNRKQDTLECLSSFMEVHWPAGWEVRLLLLDNGSTDGTVEAVQATFPHVEIVHNAENFGFARGFNEGLRYALQQGADAIFIFNNDTLFDTNLGLPLLAALDAGVAAVSPAIFYADPPTEIWSVGGGRHPWTLEMTGNHGRGLPHLPNEPFDRAFLTACALIFQSKALREIGLFDEQFFMYYEDSDWSIRAQRAGWRLRVAPKAHLLHKVAQSSGGSESPNERYYMARSSLKFFRKHATGWQWAAIIPFRLGSALRTTLRLARHKKISAISSYWRGLWDGLRDEVVPEGVNCGV